MKLHFPRITLLVVAVLTLAASSEAQAVRSGNIYSCKVAKQCAEEVLDGKHYFVMTSPQFLVRVLIDSVAKYNHAVVSVENRSGNQIQVSPSDFRIETNEANSRRMSYVEPAKLKLPRIKVEKLAKADVKTASADSKSDTKLDKPAMLASAMIAPSAVATGEVYFERTGKAESMSLVLPISGSVFEFSYTPADK